MKAKVIGMTRNELQGLLQASSWGGIVEAVYIFKGRHIFGGREIEAKKQYSDNFTGGIMLKSTRANTDV